MKRTTLLYKLGLFGMLALVLFFAVPSVYAFDGRGGDRVVIGADEVVEDDLYIGAETIIIDGVVKGDLITASRNLEVNGIVEGDLIAAGQSITVNGQVSDDIRFAGAVLTLGNEARVGGDVIAAGYSLETRPTSQVGGDLMLGAFQGLLAGSVDGDAQAGVNRLTVEGAIGGNLRAEVAPLERSANWNPNMYMDGMPAVPPVSAGLNLGDEASIGGSLVYTSRDTLDLPQAQVGGEIQHVIPTYDLESEVPVSPATVRINWMMNNFRRLVALTVVGLLLAWILPSQIRRSSDYLQTKPLASLGWGVAVLLLFPILVLMTIALVIVLALVMGALTLGNLVSVISSLGVAFVTSVVVIFAFILNYLAKIVVGYWLGRLILNRINPALVEKPYWSVLLGALILAILIAIPVLGGILSAIATVTGLGALFMIWRDRYLVDPNRFQPATPTLPQ